MKTRSIKSLLLFIATLGITWFLWVYWLYPSLPRMLSLTPALGTKNFDLILVPIVVYLLIACNIRFAFGIFKDPLFEVGKLRDGSFLGFWGGIFFGFLFGAFESIYYGAVISLTTNLGLFLFIGLVCGLFRGLIEELRN